MDTSDARVKAYITDVLKKNKTLTEREVKAAVRRGLKLGRAPLSAGVIREVRRKLGIDRPRAIAYAKSLLAKNPTLEAKKVIEDVGERFGIRLQAPDVSRLRPAGARRKKTSRGRERPDAVGPAREEGSSGPARSRSPTRPRESRRTSRTSSGRWGNRFSFLGLAPPYTRGLQ